MMENGAQVSNAWYVSKFWAILALFQLGSGKKKKKKKKKKNTLVRNTEELKRGMAGQKWRRVKRIAFR